MPPAEVKVTVWSLGTILFQVREQIGFALRSKTHDARGIGKIFQLNELVLKNLGRFAVEVAHCFLF
jgi:hypothetical protein